MKDVENLLRLVENVSSLFQMEWDTEFKQKSFLNFWRFAKFYESWVLFFFFVLETLRWGWYFELIQ